MFKGRNDWEELWVDDKESIMATMVRNMASDLDNGYNYFGACITKQKADIDLYRKDYEEKLMMFAEMDDNAVQRWCYYDMKRRGAIE